MIWTKPRQCLVFEHHDEIQASTQSPILTDSHEGTDIQAILRTVSHFESSTGLGDGVGGGRVCPCGRLHGMQRRPPRGGPPRLPGRAPHRPVHGHGQVGPLRAHRAGHRHRGLPRRACRDGRRRRRTERERERDCVLYIYIYI